MTNDTPETIGRNMTRKTTRECKQMSVASAEGSTGEGGSPNHLTEHIFHENMTYGQARKAFFEAVQGKTKEEIELISEEYGRVTSIIRAKEIWNDCTMTNDGI